ncbi:acyl-CoA dehydrogenase family protein [Nocardioides sp. B-3]|uniref:acyl-CoA dehydrogenase family protein n=1 Tax=Nocardioides sp. B-3 TaxID=2895565 RepID=UPI002152B69D|nr:acyl-CoA dehydrogenase family protein [Nocardioides sp. B-3]UUZ61259.1 hypothetical protein LP418_12060 [Nocardioides sp. B-3]
MPRCPTGWRATPPDKAVAYAKDRSVWKDQPIGSHRGIAHPLARIKIELEQSRLLQQKAAALYDAGDDFGAGEYANMAKYAGGEVACNASDVAVHTHGGNGLTEEYGPANMLVGARLGRIAPVSREMILNFVAMHSPGAAEVLLMSCWGDDSGHRDCRVGAGVRRTHCRVWLLR